MNYYNFAKKFLFKFDPEVIHDYSISMMSKTPSVGVYLGRKSSDYDFSLKVANTKWGFPIGLAAGLDKNAIAANFLANLGFGAIEVGTVTPMPQKGNDKPRLWRYPTEESLRNRMGFNNDGGERLLENIKNFEKKVPLGVNIGKNKLTSADLAYKDYKKLYDKFNLKCDYIVINVSSPNTPGLREHESRDGLKNILKNLQRKNGDTDLYVKISPDIDPNSIYDVCDLAKEYNLSGVIATNTTIDTKLGAGGISGNLLFSKARELRHKCIDGLRETPEIELIGVGGFSNYEQILEYWKYGGRALQIYSAFIFQGPQILRELQYEMQKSLIKHGCNNIDELINSLKIKK